MICSEPPCNWRPHLCPGWGQDQIFVSNVVKGLCAGKPFRFIPRGTATLKGVREPQPLYEVVWWEGSQSLPRRARTESEAEVTMFRPDAAFTRMAMP